LANTTTSTSNRFAAIFLFVLLHAYRRRTNTPPSSSVICTAAPCMSDLPKRLTYVRNEIRIPIEYLRESLSPRAAVVLLSRERGHGIISLVILLFLGIWVTGLGLSLVTHLHFFDFVSARDTLYVEDFVVCMGTELAYAVCVMTVHTGIWCEMSTFLGGNEDSMPTYLFTKPSLLNLMVNEDIWVWSES